VKRTPLKRRARLRRKAHPRRTTALQHTSSMAATDAQRGAVAGQRCIVCGTDRRIDPAHLIPRSLGGCGHPLCTVPCCRLHHRAYDRGELDLLPYLEPAWRAQLAHAVGHVGLLGAFRRITGTRSADTDPVAVHEDRDGHQLLTRRARVIRTHIILVAEEHPATRNFLIDNLAADGYRTLAAEDRAKALALLDVEHPDLVVVDVNGETLDLLDAVRSAEGLANRVDPDTPVIVLTGRTDAIHRIRLLERGGDDVVVKPFAYPELRARMAAMLRRSDRRSSPRIRRVGPVTIDVPSREVWVDEEAVGLSAKEYELLLMLSSDPTRVFTREELLRDVWGFRTACRTRTVDSHAHRLRQKLARSGATKLVVNVWGVGYRLCDQARLS
jgi:DNA-binding response OmpR family regulator